MIRAIFFDAVGTLLHPEPDVGSVYTTIGGLHGSELERQEITLRFREAFRYQEELDRTTGLRTSEARERHRWLEIVSYALYDLPGDTACLADLWDHFARPDSWRCDPNASDVLDILNGSYLLGIASNFDRRLRDVVCGHPELHAINTLVISSEVGWRKPARAFFDSVIAHAKLRADEILIVGDDLDNDIYGARNAGMSALLLDQTGTAALHDSSVLRDLSNLPAWLLENGGR